MTHRTIPVEAVQESVSRPIAHAVLKDLSKYINFGWNTDKSDFHFSINGSSTPIPRATLYNHQNDLRLPADARFEVSFDEEPTQDASMVKLGAETTKYIFVDAKQHIYIKPVYTPIKARLTVKVTARSREQVVGLYRQLTAKLYGPMGPMVHKVDYHYFIPNYVTLALVAINDLMREETPLAPSLGDYLRTHYDKSITVIGDVIAQRQKHAMKESGILIQGQFTHNASIPRPEKDDEIGTWFINLEYEYWYDRCDMLHMQHPISIYQRLLPDRFLQLDRRVTPHATIGQSSEAADAIGSWKFSRYGALNEDWYYKQPYFDSWNIHYTPKSVDPIVSYLVGVNGLSNQVMCDLIDVEDISLRPYLIEYMKATHDRLNQSGKSLLKVLAYSWDEIISPDDYYVDENLKVINTSETSVADQYHCVLGIVNDLSLLDKEYWPELATHGCFFRNYISIYHPEVPAGFHSLNEATCQMDYQEVVSIIEEALTGNSGRQIRTVNRFKLIAM